MSDINALLEEPIEEVNTVAGGDDSGISKMLSLFDDDEPTASSDGLTASDLSESIDQYIGIATQDHRDFTDKYNTVLTDGDEERFHQWLDYVSEIRGRDMSKDLYDYDLRGYYLATSGAIPDENAHLPDTFKKPNHKTFSDESKWNGVDGYEGGHWAKEDGRDVFYTGSSNLYYPEELDSYFQKNEKDVLLVDTRINDKQTAELKELFRNNDAFAKIKSDYEVVQAVNAKGEFGLWDAIKDKTDLKGGDNIFLRASASATAMGIADWVTTGLAGATAVEAGSGVGIGLAVFTGALYLLADTALEGGIAWVSNKHTRDVREAMLKISAGDYKDEAEKQHLMTVVADWYNEKRIDEVWKSKMSFAGAAASITLDMLPYVASTAGGYKAVSLGTKARFGALGGPKLYKLGEAIEGGAGRITSEQSKQILALVEHDMVNAPAKWAGDRAKAIGYYISRYSAKNAQTAFEESGVLAGFAKAGGVLATTAPQMHYDRVKEQLGNVRVKDNKLVIDTAPLPKTLRSEAMMYVDALSEIYGARVAEKFLKGVGKFAMKSEAVRKTVQGLNKEVEKLATTKIGGKALGLKKALSDTTYGRAFAGKTQLMNRLYQNAGINSMPEEIAEEYVSMVFDAAFGLDVDQRKPGQSYFSNLIDKVAFPVTHPKELGEMAVSFSIIPLGTGAFATLRGDATYKELQDASSLANRILDLRDKGVVITEEEFEKMRQEILESRGVQDAYKIIDGKREPADSDKKEYPLVDWVVNLFRSKNRDVKLGAVGLSAESFAEAVSAEEKRVKEQVGDKLDDAQVRKQAVDNVMARILAGNLVRDIKEKEAVEEALKLEGVRQSDIAYQWFTTEKGHKALRPALEIDTENKETLETMEANVALKQILHKAKNIVLVDNGTAEHRELIEKVKKARQIKLDKRIIEDIQTSPDEESVNEAKAKLKEHIQKAMGQIVYSGNVTLNTSYADSELDEVVDELADMISKSPKSSDIRIDTAEIALGKEGASRFGREGKDTSVTYSRVANDKNTLYITPMLFARTIAGKTAVQAIQEDRVEKSWKENRGSDVIEFSKPEKELFRDIAIAVDKSSQQLIKQIKEEGREATDEEKKKLANAESLTRMLVLMSSPAFEYMDINSKKIAFEQYIQLVEAGYSKNGEHYRDHLKDLLGFDLFENMTEVQKQKFKNVVADSFTESSNLQVDFLPKAKKSVRPKPKVSAAQRTVRRLTGLKGEEYNVEEKEKALQAIDKSIESGIASEDEKSKEAALRMREQLLKKTTGKKGAKKERIALKELDNEITESGVTYSAETLTDEHIKGLKDILAERSTPVAPIKSKMAVPPERATKVLTDFLTYSSEYIEYEDKEPEDEVSTPKEGSFNEDMVDMVGRIAIARAFIERNGRIFGMRFALRAGQEPFFLKAIKSPEAWEKWLNSEGGDYLERETRDIAKEAGVSFESAKSYAKFCKASHIVDVVTIIKPSGSEKALNFVYANHTEIDDEIKRSLDIAFSRDDNTELAYQIIDAVIENDESKMALIMSELTGLPVSVVEDIQKEALSWEKPHNIYDLFRRSARIGSEASWRRAVGRNEAYSFNPKWGTDRLIRELKSGFGTITEDGKSTKLVSILLAGLPDEIRRGIGYKSTEGKQGSAIHGDSDLFRVVESLKAIGGKGNVIFLDGVRMPEGVPNFTPKDLAGATLRAALHRIFSASKERSANRGRNTDEHYMHMLGRFGEKNRVVMTELPIYKTKEELYRKARPISKRIKNLPEQLRELMVDPVEYLDSIDNELLTDKEMAEIHYMIHGFYIAYAMNGNLEDYIKGNAIATAFNVVKRASQILTDGIAVDKEVNVIYLDDQTIDGVDEPFDGEAGLMPHLAKFIAEDFGSELIYNLDSADTFKAHISLRDKERRRVLVKVNWSNMEMLASKNKHWKKIYDYVYKWNEAHPDNTIDLVAFRSGAKFIGSTDVTDIDSDEPPNIAKYPAGSLIRSSWLNHEPNPLEDGIISSQRQYHMISHVIPHGVKAAQLRASVSKELLKNEVPEVSDERIGRGFTAPDHIKDALGAGESLLDPRYAPFVINRINTIVRDISRPKQARVALQKIGSGGALISGYEQTDEGLIRMPLADMNIKYARYATYGVDGNGFGTRDEAVAFIKAHRETFIDMFMPDDDGHPLDKVLVHEIHQMDNGRWFIPGEIVEESRTPADNYTSHGFLRLRNPASGKEWGDMNLSITPDGIRMAKGEDFDGDKGFVLLLYRDVKNKDTDAQEVRYIFEKGKKESAHSKMNRALMMEYLDWMQIETSTYYIAEGDIPLDVYDSIVKAQKRNIRPEQFAFNSIEGLSHHALINSGSSEAIGPSAVSNSLISTLSSFGRELPIRREVEMISKDGNSFSVQISGLSLNKYGLEIPRKLNFDAYRSVKRLTGINLNIIIDDAKDPRAYFLNLNKRTASIANFLLLTNVHSNDIGTRDKNGELIPIEKTQALREARKVMRFIASPVMRAYANYDSNSDMTLYETIKDVAESDYELTFVMALHYINSAMVSASQAFGVPYKFRKGVAGYEAFTMQKEFTDSFQRGFGLLSMDGINILLEKNDDGSYVNPAVDLSMAVVEALQKELLNRTPVGRMYSEALKKTGQIREELKQFEVKVDKAEEAIKDEEDESDELRELYTELERLEKKAKAHEYLTDAITISSNSMRQIDAFIMATAVLGHTPTKIDIAKSDSLVKELHNEFADNEFVKMIEISEENGRPLLQLNKADAESRREITPYELARIGKAFDALPEEYQNAILINQIFQMKHMRTLYGRGVFPMISSKTSKRLNSMIPSAIEEVSRRIDEFSVMQDATGSFFNHPAVKNKPMDNDSETFESFFSNNASIYTRSYSPYIADLLTSDFMKTLKKSEWYLPSSIKEGHDTRIVFNLNHEITNSSSYKRPISSVQFVTSRDIYVNLKQFANEFASREWTIHSDLTDDQFETPEQYLQFLIEKEYIRENIESYELLNGEIAEERTDDELSTEALNRLGMKKKTKDPLDLFVDSLINAETKEELESIAGKDSVESLERSKVQRRVTYKGGFENKGKGTPSGDGKDKAMRKVADFAIVELDRRKRGSSSRTSLEELQDKAEPPYSTVMLARNGTFKGKPLQKKTMKAIDKIIKESEKAGVDIRFVVGDMPDVDTQFMDYLDSKGAKYTIYHTGIFSRVKRNDASHPMTGSYEDRKTYAAETVDRVIESNKSIKDVYEEVLNDLIKERGDINRIVQEKLDKIELAKSKVAPLVNEAIEAELRKIYETPSSFKFSSANPDVLKEVINILSNSEELKDAILSVHGVINKSIYEMMASKLTENIFGYYSKNPKVLRNKFLYIWKFGDIDLDVREGLEELTDLFLSERDKLFSPSSNEDESKTKTDTIKSILQRITAKLKRKTDLVSPAERIDNRTLIQKLKELEIDFVSEVFKQLKIEENRSPKTEEQIEFIQEQVKFFAKYLSITIEKAEDAPKAIDLIQHKYIDVNGDKYVLFGKSLFANSHLFWKGLRGFSIVSDIVLGEIINPKATTDALIDSVYDKASLVPNSMKLRLRQDAQRETIFRWKKENNVEYRPEDLKKRGVRLYHAVGGYAEIGSKETWLQEFFGDIFGSKLDFDAYPELCFFAETPEKVSATSEGTQTHDEDSVVTTETSPLDKSDLYIELVEDFDPDDIIIAANRDIYSERISERVEKETPLRIPSLKHMSERSLKSSLEDTLDLAIYSTHNEYIVRLKPGNFRIVYFGTNKEIMKMVQVANQAIAGRDTLAYFKAALENRARLSHATHKLLTEEEVAMGDVLEPTVDKLFEPFNDIRKLTSKVADIIDGQFFEKEEDIHHAEALREKLAFVTRYLNRASNDIIEDVVSLQFVAQSLHETLAMYVDYHAQDLLDKDVVDSLTEARDIAQKTISSARKEAFGIDENPDSETYNKFLKRFVADETAESVIDSLITNEQKQEIIDTYSRVLDRIKEAEKHSAEALKELKEEISKPIPDGVNLADAWTLYVNNDEVSKAEDAVEKIGKTFSAETVEQKFNHWRYVEAGRGKGVENRVKMSRLNDKYQKFVKHLSVSDNRKRDAILFVATEPNISESFVSKFLSPVVGISSQEISDKSEALRSLFLRDGVIHWNMNTAVQIASANIDEDIINDILGYMQTRRNLLKKHRLPSWMVDIAKGKKFLVEEDGLTGFKLDDMYNSELKRATPDLVDRLAKDETILREAVELSGIAKGSGLEAMGKSADEILNGVRVLDDEETKKLLFATITIKAFNISEKAFPWFDKMPSDVQVALVNHYDDVMAGKVLPYSFKNQAGLSIQERAKAMLAKARGEYGLTLKGYPYLDLLDAMTSYSALIETLSRISWRRTPSPVLQTYKERRDYTERRRQGYNYAYQKNTMLDLRLKEAGIDNPDSFIRDILLSDSPAIQSNALFHLNEMRANNSELNSLFSMASKAVRFSNAVPTMHEIVDLRKKVAGLEPIDNRTYSAETIDLLDPEIDGVGMIHGGDAVHKALLTATRTARHFRMYSSSTFNNMLRNTGGADWIDPKTGKKIKATKESRRMGAMFRRAITALIEDDGMHNDPNEVFVVPTNPNDMPPPIVNKIDEKLLARYLSWVMETYQKRGYLKKKRIEDGLLMLDQFAEERGKEYSPRTRMHLYLMTKFLFSEKHERITLLHEGGGGFQNTAIELVLDDYKDHIENLREEKMETAGKLLDEYETWRKENAPHLMAWNGNETVEWFKNQFKHHLDFVNKEASGINGERWIHEWTATGFVPHYYNQMEGSVVTELELEPTTSKHESRRKYASYLEAVDQGLIPRTMDIAELYNTYSNSVASLLANRATVSAMANILDYDLLPMMLFEGSDSKGIIDEATAEALARRLINSLNANKGKVLYTLPKEKISGFELLDKVISKLDLESLGYVRVKHRYNGVKYIWVKDGKGAQLAKHILYQDYKFKSKVAQGVFDFALAVNHFAKNIGISLSLFHPTALLESFIAAFGVTGLKDAGMKGPIILPWNFLRAMRMLGEEHRRVLLDPEASKDWVSSGLVFDVGRAPDYEYVKFDSKIGEIGRKLSKHLLTKPLGASLRATSWVKFKADTWLWETLLPSMKLFTAQKVLADEIIDRTLNGVTFNEGQLKEEVAIYVNDAFGGQEWTKYTWANPQAIRWLNLFMFAPDWTISALNISGVIDAIPVTRNIIKAPMSLAHSRQRMNHYWIAFFSIVKFMIPNILQLILFEIGKMMHSTTEGDHPFSVQNPEDERSSVNITPITNMLGLHYGRTEKRKVYMHWGKQANEVFQGWLGGWDKFIDTAISKSSIAVKLGLEQGLGMVKPGWDVPWHGKGFFESLIETDGNVWDGRLAGMFKKFIPMSLTPLLDEYFHEGSGKPPTFVAPVRLGMSSFKAQQIIATVVRAYAESKNNKLAVPEYQERLDELVKEVLDEAENNGYNRTRVFRQGMAQVRGYYYNKFFEALNKGNEKKAEEYAYYLARVNGQFKNLKASVKRRYETKGHRNIPYEKNLEVRSDWYKAMKRAASKRPKTEFEPKPPRK